MTINNLPIKLKDPFNSHKQLAVDLDQELPKDGTIGRETDPTEEPDMYRQNTGSSKTAILTDSKQYLTALPPILSYCGASIMMTVINKFVLTKHFNLNLIVLLLQCAIGCSVIICAKYFRLVELRQLKVEDIKSWIPVSTSLVFVIWTGSKALQYLSIPIYTIFKNLTIIFIAYGEKVWFGGEITRLTYASFGLMVISSLVAASGELTHYMKANNLEHQISKSSSLMYSHDQESQYLVSGYFWMLSNCICSAGFVLGMRGRMKSAKMSSTETTFFNNLLSIPVLLFMSLMIEDWSASNFEQNFPSQSRFSLLSAIAISGVFAISISYTTAWCIRATSSTTYSMVGALNKLPLALSGVLFFGDILTLTSLGAIMIGFVSGLVYAYAKIQQSSQGSQGSVHRPERSNNDEYSDESADPLLPLHQKEDAVKQMEGKA